MYKFRINNEIDESYGFGTAELEAHLLEANGEDLFIDLNSLGGSVDIGLAIYAKLKRYAKDNKASITTRTDGFVCSIATIPFLAGSKRIVNEYMQPFVHEPWADTMPLTADEYSQSADMLSKVRDVLANFYTNHTELTKEEALQMMAENTWLTAEECLAIGFATEIEKLSDVNFKLVAKIKNKLIKPRNEMSKSNWRDRLNSIIGQTPEVKNELELADLSGNPIVFPELEPGATPVVGDVIVVNEDNNFTGAVETNDFYIRVEEGKIVEIAEAMEEAIDLLLDAVEDKDNELVLAKAENARLNKIISTLRKGSESEPDTDTKPDQVVTDKSETASALERAINKRKNK